MLKESLGEILKNAREQKKLDIKAVSRETNIIPRFIDALEKNDYDKFPSEIYLMGFLRSYGQFLGLDEDDLQVLYRGQQISESRTPLEELTRPTKQFHIDQFIDREKVILAMKAIGIVAALVILFFGGKKITDSIRQEGKQLTGNHLQNQDADDKDLTAIKGKKLEFTNNRVETLVKKGEAYFFTLNHNRYAFSLKEIGENQVIINSIPKNDEYQLLLDQSTRIVLPNSNQELFFTLKAYTISTAKIEIFKGKQLTSSTKPTENAGTVQTENPDNLQLKLHIQFVDNSYIEAYLDGKKKFAGIIRVGQEVYWQAKHTIQLQLGNAAGVIVNVNGQKYTFERKVVNKIFSWKKNPLDPTKFEVVVNDSQ